VGGRVAESRGRHGERGQTTLDFAVGVSLFLIVFISVFIFVPGTLQPFAEGGQEEIVSANRVADSLSEGILGDPASPHVLNATCTREFFKSNGGSPPDGCGFESGDLTKRLGLKDRQFANVTILGNLSTDGDGADILCIESDGTVAERDNCSGGTELRSGPSPPQRSGTSVKARRTVDIDGTDATLIVELW